MIGVLVGGRLDVKEKAFLDLEVTRVHELSTCFSSLPHHHSLLLAASMA